eukprot:668137-Rhodomonas_salina.2
MQVLLKRADCVAQFFICNLRCFWFYNAMIAKCVEKCNSIKKTKLCCHRTHEATTPIRTYQGMRGEEERNP